MMEKDLIIARLPYSKPFLFVDEIISIDENGVEGKFTYDPEMDFYKGHFKDFPVTPGVILTETMAQIGVVCLGIFLTKNDDQNNLGVAFTSADAEFMKPVFPGETVFVTSKKIYFRFGKLKCEVTMKNSRDEIVCKAIIAGMLSNKKANNE